MLNKWVEVCHISCRVKSSCFCKKLKMVFIINTDIRPCSHVLWLILISNTIHRALMRPLKFSMLLVSQRSQNVCNWYRIFCKWYEGSRIATVLIQYPYRNTSERYNSVISNMTQQEDFTVTGDMMNFYSFTRGSLIWTLVVSFPLIYRYGINTTILPLTFSPAEF